MGRRHTARAAPPDPRGIPAGPRPRRRHLHRLESCWYADGAIYFNATNGGDQNAGQVWQYRPTGTDTGELVLIFESASRDVLNSPDNICVSPRGGIVTCEDTDGDMFVRGLSAEGHIFDFVQQPIEPTCRRETTEFAGVLQP